VSTPTAVDPATLVDLEAYPLLDLDQPAAAALIERARAEFEATGACELPGFLTADGLAACVADAVGLEPLAHHSSGATTPYLEQPDDHWDDDHPRKRRDPFALGAVGYDLFPTSSPIRALYEWPPLLDFVAAVLGRDEVHRYADPLGALNIATMGEGDVLGWHFDQTDFVVSLALRSADEGGSFEVVPGTRTPDDECYERVGAVLDGSERPDVLPNRAGTLLVFAGRCSLHRVSPISGSTTRLIALFGFDTEPGTRSSPTLQLSRYGRTAQ
jgi:hypothetical protein